jgi:hypothetical protein
VIKVFYITVFLLAAISARQSFLSHSLLSQSPSLLMGGHGHGRRPSAVDAVYFFPSDDGGQECWQAYHRTPHGQWFVKFHLAAGANWWAAEEGDWSWGEWVFYTNVPFGELTNGELTSACNTEEYNWSDFLAGHGIVKGQRKGTRKGTGKRKGQETEGEETMGKGKGAGTRKGTGKHKGQEETEGEETMGKGKGAGEAVDPCASWADAESDDENDRALRANSAEAVQEGEESSASWGEPPPPPPGHPPSRANR